MTAPERKLWSHLRMNQFYSLKFRRQHGIGSYIVDFYCPQLKVVIEIDGESHYEISQVNSDAERESLMNSLGVRTIRYSNHDVMSNIDGVLVDLAHQLQLECSTSPNPSLQRRGGEL